MKKTLRNILLGTIAATALFGGCDSTGSKKPRDSSEISFEMESYNSKSARELCNIVSEKEWVKAEPLKTKRWFHSTGRLNNSGRPVGSYGAMTYLLDSRDNSTIISPGFHSITPLGRDMYLGRIGSACYVLRYNIDGERDSVDVIAKTEGASNPPRHE
ncbi:MAG: hypothetical protein AABX79_02065 [Nanoarchaeota archaeon]